MNKAAVPILNLPLTKPNKNGYLLALSGGVDSMVLAHLLKKNDITFAVAHCNFQLRGPASDQDAAFVRQWAIKNDVPCFQIHLATIAHANYTKVSIQMAARALRYKWFDDLCALYNFDCVLTAHHLDDQLETYLMHTFRATGIKGLLGIPEKNKMYFRPLLQNSKASILNYAQSQDLLWREDASNKANYYLRNQLRNQVIPELLKATTPHGLDAFARTIGHLSDTHAFIDHFFKAWQQKHFCIEQQGVKIDLMPLQALAPLEFGLHQLFGPYGFSAKEVNKLMGTTSGKSIFSERYQLLRERDHLFLSAIKQTVEPHVFLIKKNANLISEPIRLSIQTSPDFEEPKSTNPTVVLDEALLTYPLEIRKWQKGDFIYPTGMKGRKLISKYFKDEKYTTLAKENQWLLVSNSQVVWIIGKRCDRRFIAKKKTKNKLLITLLK